MAAIELGWKAIEVKPIFARGQDWIVTLIPETSGGPPVYPDDTEITAVIYPAGTEKLPLDDWVSLAEWPAVIVDDEVRWKVESALTDEIPAKSLIRIYVKYPNSPTTDDYRWAKGVVARDD